MNYTINPCINCLTFPICKNQLTQAMIKMMSMTLAFPPQYKPYEVIVYRAAQDSLLDKCVLIYEHVMSSRFQDLSYNRSTLLAINKAFDILEDGELKVNYPATLPEWLVT